MSAEILRLIGKSVAPYRGNLLGEDRFGTIDVEFPTTLDAANWENCCGIDGVTIRDRDPKITRARNFLDPMTVQFTQAEWELGNARAMASVAPIASMRTWLPE